MVITILCDICDCSHLMLSAVLCTTVGVLFNIILLFNVSCVKEPIDLTPVLRTVLDNHFGYLAVGIKEWIFHFNAWHCLNFTLRKLQGPTWRVQSCRLKWSVVVCSYRHWRGIWFCWLKFSTFPLNCGLINEILMESQRSQTDLKRCY